MRAPFVLRHKSETLASPTTVTTLRGITYASPGRDARHRDVDEVLWAVCAGTPTGSACYAEELHPDRQRTAMEQFLCAGCKKPAARDERGMAWILPLLDNATDTVWEGAQTAIPPVCEMCVVLSPQVCPGFETDTLSSGYARPS